MPDVRQVCVSFDGDFYIAAFVLERGFAGVFHDGNVGRRAFYGKFDRIGFAFAIAVAIIQPFAALGEVQAACTSSKCQISILSLYTAAECAPNLGTFATAGISCAESRFRDYSVWAVGWVQAAFGILPYSVFISFETAGLQFDSRHFAVVPPHPLSSFHCC